ncbi:hypothetical protein RDV64_14135 [Acuticoccus sp. MNP-M23]|uniref:hypothetical protein n=1 Tax=Acuticoccus sp. MNP-M23 TaxID=3072793 RepID=UPI0028165A04|nr:hypothetical protein [Acuticoccus sp. MNP-M23]WMS41217.1 hypothetical protein RDV64_14135 [Acuticoccus sp. MNP-M23]
MNPEPPPARRPPRPGARAALSAAGPLFFLPPVLAVADRDWSLFGIPALVIYVFSVWLVGIVLIALTAHGRARR